MRRTGQGLWCGTLPPHLKLLVGVFGSALLHGVLMLILASGSGKQVSAMAAEPVDAVHVRILSESIHVEPARPAAMPVVPSQAVRHPEAPMPAVPPAAMAAVPARVAAAAPTTMVPAAEPAVSSEPLRSVATTGTVNQTMTTAGSGAKSTAAKDASATAIVWRDVLSGMLFQRKRYPVQARRMRLQGTVEISAEFSAKGELIAVAVSRSSGYDSLDAAAMQLLRESSEAAAHASGGPERHLHLTIPVVYSLVAAGGSME
ncbi:MAG: energy transducer TonB [Aquabacterium sp.]|uniref:energy transducer TonB n=1 Tax=Aquabacterium sp. TaxID=1872578 RepID=UPI003BE08D85